MFGVSLPELLLIFILVLIIFGPEKLPEIANTLGRAFATIRKNSDQIKREFYNAVYTPAEDFKQSIKDSSRELSGLLSPEEEAELVKPDPNCPDFKPTSESEGLVSSDEEGDERNG